MSRPMRRPAFAALFMALTLGAAHAASPDDGLVPPGLVGPDQPYQPPSYQVSPLARSNSGDSGYLVAQDNTMGDLLVRIQRLEGDNRRLSGTIEDLQGQIRKLQDDMKRQQDDTEYRLQALEGGGKGGAPAPKPAPSQPQKKSGLGAPPKPLGSLPSQGQAGDQNEAAMQGQTGEDQSAAAPAPAPRARTNSSTIAPGLPGVAVDTTAPLASNDPSAGTAPTAPGTPEEEYTADYRLIEAQKYDAAEAAFRSFVTAHPKDKHVPDAIHWIGESLFQRKQYTDAAEQFAKVTKTYAKSARAPSSMLRLGMALAALGEKEAACATFQAVPSKYPKASPTILSGADREAKKNSCTAG